MHRETLSDMTTLALPGPWRFDAACSPEDGDGFFPTEPGDPDKVGIRRCSWCRVRLDCLDFAVRSRQPEGIWGGLTQKQLRRLWTRYLPDPTSER